MNPYNESISERHTISRKFEPVLRQREGSLTLTIPKHTAEFIGILEGDAIDVQITKMPSGRIKSQINTKFCASVFKQGDSLMVIVPVAIVNYLCVFAEEKVQIVILKVKRGKGKLY